MRKIRKILRLKFECDLANRKIAESTSIVGSTVGDYVSRAIAAVLSWPLPENRDDARFEQIWFELVARIPRAQRPPLNFSYIHKELKRKGVPLMLLWHEYKSPPPGISIQSILPFLSAAVQ